MATKVLDVAGLVGLIVAGALVAVPVGVAVFGGSCLWLSWSLSRGDG